MRVARSTCLGGVQSEIDPNMDCCRVTGIVHCCILYHDVEAVCQAQRKLDVRKSHHIRACNDDLLDAGDGGEKRPRSARSKRTELSEMPRSRPDIKVWVEVNGVICLVRLAITRIFEVEDERLIEGRRLREELRAAIVNSSPARAHEALEYAAERLDALANCEHYQHTHAAPRRPGGLQRLPQWER